MSSTVSLYLRSQLLRRYFLDSAGEEVYIALTREVGEANSPGDQLDEPVGEAYARISYPLGELYWAETGFGEVYNLETAYFAPNTGPWGLMGGWALVTAPTSGMTLAVGTLTTPTFVDVEPLEPVLEMNSITVGLYD